MVKELTEFTFKDEVQKSEKPVLVKFYRKEGCQPCKDMLPVFDKFAEDHPELSCMAYEVPQTPDSIMRDYFIQRWPTFLSFKNGEIITKRMGRQTPEQLLKMMEKNLMEDQVKELKAKAFDLIRNIEGHQNQINQIQQQLQQVNAEITKLESQK